MQPGDGDEHRDRDPVEAYDALADGYRESVEGNPYDANWEFPGTTALLPNVADDRVLDAACGAGRYTEWLLERGAEVVAFDASGAMLAAARERVDDGATFHHARLEEPLEFAADGAFDGVVCGLALDYVADWEPPLREFARVLAPGGFLVLSVSHPIDEWRGGDEEGEGNEGGDYFGVERREKAWAETVPYYRRPLGAMVNPLLSAGFHLAEIAEPRPTDEFACRWPERYERERTEPVFLCLRARKAAGERVSEAG